MIKKIREYTFSNDVPLQERRFVLTGVVACLAVIAVLLSVITSQQSLMFGIGLVLVLAIIMLIIRYTLLSKRYNLGGSLLVLLCNFVVVPAGYSLGGGVDSGAPLWLVPGIVIIFILFRGPQLIIYLIVTAVAFFLTMYIPMKHPELVVPLQGDYSKDLDSYIAIISVSIICGILFLFQSIVLERELDRSEAQRKEIQKLSDQQNSFFSSMSHEIRTPISTIIGLNEMTMREKVLSPEVQDNTLNIQNASKMLLSLINDLLDMSKIQSGKMEIVSVDYDTSKMLSDITNLHWNRAMEKNLSFDIQVGENIPPILHGDETRIKQIIINLVSNAIKYTQEGSVILRFGGDPIDDERFLLCVEVEDTGIGIRKEDVQYLFDAFRRVEGEDTKNIEGTGLGLSITKQLVELMGGTITVNSIYTKGSTFRVEIPQGISKADSTGFQKPGVIRSDQQEYHQSFEAPKARVLVVDDNDMNRIVCRKLLRATKVQVDLAESGKECLEKTRENHYDVIFMDHEMPQMDGIETLHRIRQQNDGLCKETPVIALTANAGSDRDAFYLEKGFSAYISKPIQSKRLEALLLACLPDDMIEQTFTEQEDEKEESYHVSDAVSKKQFVVTTDSICDIPSTLLQDKEILIMPYYVRTGGGRFLDMEEIDADNLQQILESDRFNAESVPAPLSEYEAFFAEALTESRHVIHISSSKNISTAYENALLAAESFGNVQVIDSGVASSALGLAAIRAADMLRSGMRVEEVEKDIELYVKRLEINYLVPMILKTNSKYSTGLLGRFMINVLNLEPVFTIKKGRTVIKRFLFGYARSTPEQFVKQSLRDIGSIKKDKLVVSFSGCSAELRERIMNEIESLIHFDEIIVNKASATTFINCGPNSVGLVYERVNEEY